jgi:sec-independent protein translocase protein TatC
MMERLEMGDVESSESLESLVERREPLLHHIGDLFRALKRVVIWILLGLGVGYLFSSELLAWLEAPYVSVMGSESKLIYIDPFEKVWVHLRVSMWAGLFVVAPFLYLSIFSFVKPALYRAERRRLHMMMLVVFVVFALGLYLGQKYSVPLLLKALMNFKTLSEAPFLSLSAYTGMAMGTLLATALLLELPVLMFHLSLWGWVRSSTWSEIRRVAIVANAVVSAFLSPPDVMSMLVLMLPIQVLYECGIICARVAEWTRNEKH